MTKIDIFSGFLGAGKILISGTGAGMRWLIDKLIPEL